MREFQNLAIEYTASSGPIDRDNDGIYSVGSSRRADVRRGIYLSLINIAKIPTLMKVTQCTV